MDGGEAENYEGYVDTMENGVGNVGLIIEANSVEGIV